MASWVSKVGGGIKYQFFDRQPEIFDGGDYGCSKFRFYLRISSKWGFLVLNYFLFCVRKLSDEKNIFFRGWKFSGKGKCFFFCACHFYDATDQRICRLYKFPYVWIVKLLVVKTARYCALKLSVLKSKKALLHASNRLIGDKTIMTVSQLRSQ